MRPHTKSNSPECRPSQPDLKVLSPGYSCVELILGVFTISAACVAWTLIVGRFGPLIAITGAIVTVTVCILISSGFYVWIGRSNARKNRELAERFRFVHRVIEVSDAQPSVKKDGVQIRVGDFGWEAEPILQDGLTYLQGLNEKWEVVWYAGFHRDQIELVTVKPRSQYFLPYSWTCAGALPPACPYSVSHDSDKTLGFPQRVDLPFVQGLRIDPDRLRI